MPQKAPKAQQDNPFVKLLGKVAPRVDARLAEVLSTSLSAASAYGREPGVMVEAVRDLCSRGGKRLRPALAAVGALCQDEEFDLAPCIEAGVSLELLQAYFLIHDDWMDEDETRRGGPTAHVELRRRLKSKKLGDKSAILAGDHAVALAQAHLCNIPTTPARLKRCLRRFAEMQLAAVAGQQLDVTGKARHPELTYELKTASYTVSGPLLVGAELAGAKGPLLEALRRYARPAGVAFQLRDDLVGVFGSPEVTGKPQGGDLREGKNTSLLHEAKQRSRKGEWAIVAKVLGQRGATTKQIRDAIAALEACGAKTAIEARIETLIAEADAEIASAPLTSKGRKLLSGATSTLARRTS